MQPTNAEVIAICLADIHLCSKVPIWRSNEPDWYEAMKRPLLEVKHVQEEYQCPILCAGDIVDRWDSSAELINFAIDYLPEMLAIPGQHDMPHHNMSEIKKSAFYTLVQAKKITPLESYDSFEWKGMSITGFPYGEKIREQLSKRNKHFINIAIAHQYVWNKKAKYPGAKEEDKITSLSKKLKGYDIAIFGDNHKSFSTHVDKTMVWNCGGLIRRKSDEANYKPRLGLILSNGSVEAYYLDTSKDKHLEINQEELKTNDFDMSDFVQQLEKLDSNDLDFSEAVKQYFDKNKVKKEIREIILKAIKNE